jgi:O-antigen/teichoic acid export membrane protein
LSEPPPAVTRSEVARGAGLAGLARLSVGIEALSQPWYIWLFGLPTYGIYVVLWGGVNFLSNLLDLSMTNALQRVVPQQEDDAAAHAAVKFALILSVGLTSLAALVISLDAANVAQLFSVAPGDQAQLPMAIALFAWALPLWTFVEVATSAARARRAFGPEIRLRLFWEQLVRIGFAGAAFAIGFHSIGLIVAHLASLALTALLSLRLLGRYYDLRLMWRAPITRPLARNLIVTGLGLLPSSLSTRALIDAPPVVLNFLIPGTQGAAAAGLFEIGRKLSTVPYIVRQAFQYVLAPLSSAQARTDRAAIATLYHFASRVSTALVVPLAGLMIFAGPDVLSVYRKEALPALAILIVLAAARALEAIVGPASSIVEMIGHRLLPLLNSMIAILLWIALTVLLVPTMGALGMAVAVAAATIAPAYAAMIELRVSDGISPFDYKLFQALGLALIGMAAMWSAEWLFDGLVRFVTLMILWPITSWFTLRYGLTLEDRKGLGGLARRLRLI